MRRTVLVAFAFACACHKREDAAQSGSTPTPDPIAASAAPSDTTAATTPSAIASGLAAPIAVPSGSVSFGMIGLLGATPDASVPWGRDDTLGTDPTSARGNMWGDPIGDSFGAGGLGLRGASDAGARGEGIGLGNIGTIGHGSGTGQGYGPGGGRLGGNSQGAPRIRQGVTTVNGRLPPEVIQRIVRQNFGRFRLCYEQGLRRDPKMAGTIATKFSIDTSGAVNSISRDASSTMTDATVVSCVTRAFSNLSFPQPEGGIVTVVYPLIFDPPATP